MRILTITFRKALAHSQDRRLLGDAFLRRSDAAYRRILAKFPREASDIALGELDEPPNENPFDEIDVEWTNHGLRRKTEGVSDLAKQRFAAISEMASSTFEEYPDNIQAVVATF